MDKWIGAAANIGVILGLGLVAFQINQSIELARAQMINQYYLADMQLELKMMGENPGSSFRKAVFEPNNLEEDDLVVLDRYFNYGMVQLVRLYRMEELGLGDGDMEARVDYLRWHLGNPVGRRWWIEYRKGVGAEFAALVDELLFGADINQNKAILEIMRADPDGESWNLE